MSTTSTCVSIIEHFISCEIKHDSRSFSCARARSAFYSLSHINCHCRSPQAQLNVEWEKESESEQEGERNKDVQRYMCSCSSGSKLLTSCPFTPIVHIHHRHQFIDEESWVEKKRSGDKRVNLNTIEWQSLDSLVFLLKENIRRQFEFIKWKKMREYRGQSSYGLSL